MVWGRSDPVTLEIVEGGTRPCQDAALLRIDPEFVDDAKVPDISFVEALDGQNNLSAFEVKGFDVPPDKYPLHPVNSFTYTQFSAKAEACSSWVPGCCTGHCISFTGFNIDGGHSGGPLIDQFGRVYGLVSQRAKNASDTGWAIPTSMLIDLLTTGTSVAVDRVSEIAAWSKKKEMYPRFGSSERATTLSLTHVFRKLIADPSTFGITPTIAGCPLTKVAEHRQMDPDLKYLIESYAMVGATAETGTTGKAARVLFREAGQHAFQEAQRAQTDGRRVDAGRNALLAAQHFRFALSGYLATEDGPGYLAAISQSFPAQTDRDEVAKVVDGVAGVFGVREPWGPDIDPKQSKVLSSLLREYADASIIAAKFNPTLESESRLTIAAGAARWSAELAPDSRGVSLALRTYGDALSASGRIDDAVIAYSQSAVQAPQGTYVKSIYPRLLEVMALSHDAARTTGGGLPINLDNNLFFVEVGAASLQQITPQTDELLNAIGRGYHLDAFASGSLFGAN